MASIYNISSGTPRVEIARGVDSYLAIQLTAASLDANVTYKLQHSSDGVNFFDISGTNGTLVSASDSALVETYDFTLDVCYLYVDVGSATTGDITIIISNKKKDNTTVNNSSLNPVPVTEQNPVLNETNIDAFNRLRTSQINSQADLKQIYDELPLFYDIELVGAASYNWNSASSDTTLTVVNNGDAAIMQTKQRYNYSTGKSSLILITFRNFNEETRVIKRVGYYNSTTTTPFDANKDGLYIAIAATGGVFFVIAKNGVNNSIPQSSWDDPMDGTGASGIDLQLGTETGNILMWIDFEWLGVGQVRFGFVKNGVFYVAHKVDHIGENGAYMLSPNHSIRAELLRSGSSGTGGSLTLICATYGTEGEVNTLGKILSSNMGNTHVDANLTTSTYALMGIRLGSNYLDTLVDVLSFTLLAISNDSQRWELWLNPTVAGTFTYNAVSNSSVEIAKGSGSGNTVTTTGATLLDSGYISASTSSRFDIQSAIRLGATIAGVADEIVLCTTPLSSNSDVIASLTWREVS